MNARKRSADSAQSNVAPANVRGHLRMAWRLLHNSGIMVRRLRMGWVLLLCVSALVSRPAVAGQAQPTATTDIAEATAAAAERQVSQLTSQRALLAKRYQDELDAIDRLKKQRASWR